MVVATEEAAAVALVAAEVDLVVEDRVMEVAEMATVEEGMEGLGGTGKLADLAEGLGAVAKATEAVAKAVVLVAGVDWAAGCSNPNRLRDTDEMDRFAI